MLIITFYTRFLNVTYKTFYTRFLNVSSHLLLYICTIYMLDLYDHLLLF